jgi:Uma2 family endonuclease
MPPRWVKYTEVAKAEGNPMADAPIKTRMKLAEFHRYLEKNADSERFLELIDGEIEEKMPTDEHGYLVSELIMLIGPFLKVKRLGRIGTEVRYELSGEGDNSRLPDLAIILDIERPVQTSGAVRVMPDIAIEVQSPRQSRPQLRGKAEYYLANGAQQAWIVYPKTRKIEILTENDTFLYEEGDIIVGGDLLPGFTLDVSALFDYQRAE